VSDPDLILLVEDNEANSMLASAVLEREGFQVEVAASAAEALDLLYARNFDLVLMDVQLPGEDGLTFTRRLKSHADTASLPIVALTAHAMAGDRERALEAGCVGYVSKPIDTRTFGSQIRGLLDSVRAAVPKEGIAS
jgi:two-component system, cell cycle response regulator DivK